MIDAKDATLPNCKVGVSRRQGPTGTQKQRREAKGLPALSRPCITSTTLPMRSEILMRIALLVSLFLLMETAPAAAQFDGPGAQGLPTTVQAVRVTTVQAVREASKDDQIVTLRGHILEKVGDEKYAFSDETGQIRIEIDDEVFQQRITPEMEIEIYGEVEDDFLQSPEIDVERLTIVGEKSNGESGQQGGSGQTGRSQTGGRSQNGRSAR